MYTCICVYIYIYMCVYATQENVFNYLCPPSVELAVCCRATDPVGDGRAAAGSVSLQLAVWVPCASRKLPPGISL